MDCVNRRVDDVHVIIEPTPAAADERLDEIIDGAGTQLVVALQELHSAGREPVEPLRLPEHR